MASDFTIIENNNKAQEEYGFLYGVNYWKMSKKDIKALLDGKCLVSDDGEYVTFITLSGEKEKGDKK